MILRLKWMAPLLVLLGFAVPAMANNVTLGSETQTCSATMLSGCISVEKTGTDSFLVTIPNPMSGATLPAGTYSFNGVGALTFSGTSVTCTNSFGCPFTSGTGGTISVSADGITNAAITWDLLDGDGHGYTLDFSFLGGTYTGDLTASTSNVVKGPHTFSVLFGDPIGTTAYWAISSGEVDHIPEPGSAALVLMVVGIGLLLRKRALAA